MQGERICVLVCACACRSHLTRCDGQLLERDGLHVRCVARARRLRHALRKRPQQAPACLPVPEVGHCAARVAQQPRAVEQRRGRRVRGGAAKHLRRRAQKVGVEAQRARAVQWPRSRAGRHGHLRRSRPYKSHQHSRRRRERLRRRGAPQREDGRHRLPRAAGTPRRSAPPQPPTLTLPTPARAADGRATPLQRPAWRRRTRRRRRRRQGRARLQARRFVLQQVHALLTEAASAPQRVAQQRSRCRGPTVRCLSPLPRRRGRELRPRRGARSLSVKMRLSIELRREHTPTGASATSVRQAAQNRDTRHVLRCIHTLC